MKMGVQSFRGARLREARLARGMFKNVLADLVGVSGTAIGRYEDDVDKPQEDRVKALSASLGFSVEFFLKPEWPEKPDLVFWRNRATDTKLSREMTEQRMKWLCEVFSFIESEVDFPVHNIPDLRLPDDFRLYTSDNIELAAEALRTRWRLGEGPIPDVSLALENAGIPVVFLDFQSEKQDGFCFRSDSLQRIFVGINKYHVSAARARFDAAHELGHAVLHRRVLPSHERDPVLHKLIEQQAHRFAGAFLFPETSFRKEVRSVSLDFLASLKRRWGISIGAMIYRAGDLGLVDEEERTHLYRNMTRRGWRGPMREPFDRPGEMPTERPRMLKRGIDLLLSEGLLSRCGLQSALSFPAKEIEQLIGLDAGFFDLANEQPMATLKGARAVDLESGNVLEFRKRGRS